VARRESGRVFYCPNQWKMLMAKAPRGFDLLSKAFAQRDYASANVAVSIDAREFEAVGKALQRFSGKKQNFIPKPE
jgi:hypothetical protein